MTLGEFDFIASQNAYWIISFLLGCAFFRAVVVAPQRRARFAALMFGIIEMCLALRLGAWYWAVVTAPVVVPKLPFPEGYYAPWIWEFRPWLIIPLMLASYCAVGLLGVISDWHRPRPYILAGLVVTALHVLGGVVRFS